MNMKSILQQLLQRHLQATLRYIQVTLNLYVVQIPRKQHAAFPAAPQGCFCHFSLSLQLLLLLLPHRKYYKWLSVTSTPHPSSHMFPHLLMLLQYINDTIIHITPILTYLLREKKEKENHKLFFFHIPEQKRSCLLPKSPLIDVHTLGCIISKKIVDYHLGVVEYQNI